MPNHVACPPCGFTLLTPCYCTLMYHCEDNALKLMNRTGIVVIFEGAGEEGRGGGKIRRARNVCYGLRLRGGNLLDVYVGGTTCVTLRITLCSRYHTVRY